LNAGTGGKLLKIGGAPVVLDNPVEKRPVQLAQIRQGIGGGGSRWRR